MICEILSLKDIGGNDLDLLGLCDVVGHVTIGVATYGFLQVVNLNQPSISHCGSDTEPQRYRGHDLLGSRDVIGRATTGLAICGFL